MSGYNGPGADTDRAPHAPARDHCGSICLRMGWTREITVRLKPDTTNQASGSQRWVVFKDVSFVTRASRTGKTRASALRPIGSCGGSLCRRRPLTEKGTAADQRHARRAGGLLTRATLIWVVALGARPPRSVKYDSRSSRIARSARVRVSAATYNGSPGTYLLIAPLSSCSKTTG